MGIDGEILNDNLHQAPFYRKTQASSIFNQLFAALWDLILCRVSTMSTFAPDSHRSLTDIFDEKIPAVDGCTEEGDVNAEEKQFVSPALIACFKWPIYTAPLKDPFAEP